MEELIEKIRKWGTENGLNNIEPMVQTTKMVEEVSEVQKAILTETHTHVATEIGDVLVTAIVLVQQLETNHCFNFNVQECLQLAYEKLMKRSGKIVNGVFVKEGDL